MTLHAPSPSRRASQPSKPTNSSQLNLRGRPKQMKKRLRRPQWTISPKSSKKPLLLVKTSWAGARRSNIIIFLRESRSCGSDSPQTTTSKIRKQKEKTRSFTSSNRSTVWTTVVRGVSEESAADIEIKGTDMTEVNKY